MQEFILTGLLGCVLIGVCCLNIYEMMRYIGYLLPKFTFPARMRVLVVVGFIFLAHIINIWLFGFVYYLMHFWGYGTLTGAGIDRGQYILDIFTFMYFSGSIYSTLGLGDISPEGALRMITGVEALAGFILIGWTVSFTFLAMQRFWRLPHH